MGDEHGGDARFFLNAANFLPGLQTQPRVQIGQGFVQQQHPRHLHQRPGNGHALLLTAGKFAGLAVQQLFDLHQPGRRPGTVQHLLLGQLIRAGQVLQREQDILQHRHVGIQGVVLKHQPNAALFSGKLGHIVLAEENFAGGGLLQTADHVQRGAFAAAGGPQQTDQLAVGNFKIEVVDGDHLFAGFFVAAGKDFRQFFKNDLHGRPLSFAWVVFLAHAKGQMVFSAAFSAASFSLKAIMSSRVSKIRWLGRSTVTVPASRS